MQIQAVSSAPMNSTGPGAPPPARPLGEPVRPLVSQEPAAATREAAMDADPMAQIEEMLENARQSKPSQHDHGGHLDIMV